MISKQLKPDFLHKQKSSQKMRRRGVMKIFLFLLFTFFTLNVFGQTKQISDTIKPVGIEEIYLAKDDGKGNEGDVAESFNTNDIPIYCVVQLDSMKPTTVKMHFVAVSVKGVKPETKVVTVSYKTNGKQNRVSFTGRPDTVWTAGTYRIDIFLDGKLVQSKSLEIKNAPNLPEAANSFQPAKQTAPPKPKPRRTRKN